MGEVPTGSLPFFMENSSPARATAQPVRQGAVFANVPHSLNTGKEQRYLATSRPQQAHAQQKLNRLSQALTGALEGILYFWRWGINIPHNRAVWAPH